MDALRHADEILAALWQRHPEFALPGHVGSPMDDRATITIPQALIDACEPDRPERPEDTVAPAVPVETVDAEMRRAAAGLPPPRLRDSA